MLQTEKAANMASEPFLLLHNFLSDYYPLQKETVTMADEGGSKKRSFRKYTYRGVDLDQLLDMSTDELVELFPARQRRR